MYNIIYKNKKTKNVTFLKIFSYKRWQASLKPYKKTLAFLNYILHINYYIMKKILTFTAMMLLLLLTIGNIWAEYNQDKSVNNEAEITTTSINLDEEEMMFCPEYYDPVCAQPPMPECPEWMYCIQVMPALKTYSNECFAWLDNAEILYKWVCEGDDYLDYSDTSKTMHPSWDLNRDWINDCEDAWTCDHTIDYTKPRTYSNSEDFLKAEWHICKTATDGCNTIQIWNWWLGASTMMYCEDVYWEGWQEKWSCLTYIDDKSQEQKEAEEYIRDNISNLVSKEAVLGWSWYVANFNWIDEENVEVIAEEWHIQDEFIFNINDIKKDEDINMVMCTMEYAPVCWIDWKTYWNRCVSELQNKVKVAYVWECSDYVDINKFNKYKEYNSWLEYLLTKKTTKQLENALDKLEDMIEATKLQKIAKWLQVERITIFKYFREIIRNEYQNR